jgi:hypothetical protein
MVKDWKRRERRGEERWIVVGMATRFPDWFNHCVVFSLSPTSVPSVYN